MSARKIRVGSWELRHHILRPSRCLLQTHSQRLQKAITPPQDPIITFRLTAHPPTPHSPPKDGIPRTVSIHRCLLRAAGGPLEALVTAPFAESEMSEIVIHETFECFDVVRRFLYCEPIRMVDLPSDLPLVADRWGLSVLFEACFTHAEERAHAHAGVPKLSVAELIITYLPIMAVVDVPDRFKTYLALRLGIEIKTVDSYFKKHPLTPTSMDDICCIQHDDSVTCRRRRVSICAGKDQEPCTTIENACAQSASVKSSGEPAEETDETKQLTKGKDDTPNPDEDIQPVATSESPASPSAMKTSEDPKSADVIEASSDVLEDSKSGEDIEGSSDAPEQPDSSAEGPSASKEPPTAEETVSGATAEAPSDGDAVATVDDTVNADVDGAHVQDTHVEGTNVEDESMNGANMNGININDNNANGADEIGTGVGTQQPQQQNVGIADIADAPVGNIDGNADHDASEGTDEIVPTDSHAITAPAASSTGTDPPSTDAVQEPSASHQTDPSEEGSTHEGSNSYMSFNDIREGSGAPSTGKDSEEEEEEEKEDLATSDAPQRADWHETFNVWQVFQSRNMLDEIIHYLSHYGPDDYTPLILDVVLRILERDLSDDEITRLLREIDWDWENPSCQTLNSKSANTWSPRAWRLLACARVGFSGAGSDIRMSWNYSDLFRDMHTRATELANRSNNDSDSDSSHSSVDDDTDFTVDWSGKDGDEHFDFSLTLQCDCMALDHLSQLNLRVRLVEKEDAPLDKQTGRREVSARIKVIESGCGCDLPHGQNDRNYQGFTASPLKNMDSRSTLWSYKDAGVNYKVMCSEDLGAWMKRHRMQCGLVFQVRLYVYPLDDDDDEKKKPARKADQNKNECTCGFCTCDACSSEGQQEEENQEELI